MKKRTDGDLNELVESLQLGLRSSVNTWFEDRSLKEREELLALQDALRQIGNAWSMEQIPLTAVYVAAKITEELAAKRFKAKKKTREALGVIVFGTMSEDYHSLGKSITKRILSPFFEIYDLGNDIAVESFIKKAEEVKADIIAVSALMMNSILQLPELRDAIESVQWKKKPKLLVGGAPFYLNSELCRKTKADGCAGNAFDAVEKAIELLED